MIWPWEKSNRAKQRDKTKQLERAVSIEVQNHNNAADEIVAEANKVANNFNRIINENGFSLVITVGAARKHK